MASVKRMSLQEFQERFGTEEKCRTYLEKQRWPEGYICPKCGARKCFHLSNGLLQCSVCRHQTSVTAGTVMHRTHLPLTKWFEALYFVSQDKRGISAVELQARLGVTYKTAWYLLHRIRQAMGRSDDQHRLDGVIEFDDAFFGGPTTGKKRGRGTEKAKVFVALSLDKKGRPKFLKMKTTKDIRQKSVKGFADRFFRKSSVIFSDGYRSYIPALTEYKHHPAKYDPHSGMLRWLHIVIGNAKAFILGTYHGLPARYLDSYLDEFCFRFSRRFDGSQLFQRLAFSLARPSAELKG